MNRAVIRIGFLPWTLVLVSSALSQTKPDQSRTNAKTPGLASQPALRAQIDQYVAPFVRTNNFSGVILIARGEKKLFEQGYGYANRELKVKNGPETRFHIASVSKTFTAAAILLLEQDARLSVRDRLTKWVPDYAQGDKITIHHLLTHTSGIPNVNNFPDYDKNSLTHHSLEEIISWFKNKPLDFEPGAKYSYSNSNYNLLAYIVEKASGKSYGDFLEERIFSPLHLSHTGHDAGTAILLPDCADGYMPARADEVENAPSLDWSVKTGNGSIFSTAEDLYAWARALKTDKLLRADARTKLFADHGDGVGYGWFVRSKAKHPSIAMNGRAPGFTANLEYFPENDTYVVILSNLYSSITHAMAGDIGTIALGDQRKPAFMDVAALPPSHAVLDLYAGEYLYDETYRFSPNRSANVERRGDWLVLITGGGTASYLLPQAEHTFLDRIYGGIVRFKLDSRGKVAGFDHDFGAFGSYPAVRR